MTRDGALNADDIHHARRTPSADPHLFREVAPRGSTHEGIVVPRTEGARGIGRRRRCRSRRHFCLRPEVLDHHVIPVVTFLMPQHDEVLGHRRKVLSGVISDLPRAAACPGAALAKWTW